MTVDKLVKMPCPTCDKTVGVRADQFGRRVRCPACRTVFGVARPGTASQDPSPTPQTAVTPSPDADGEMVRLWAPALETGGADPRPPDRERGTRGENPPGPGRFTPLRRALSAARAEIAATAAVTAGHAGRAGRWGKLLVRRGAVRRRLAADTARLGEAVVAAGLGEPGLRAQLAQLDERIHNVRTANGSVRALGVERRGVVIRIAEPFAGADTAPAEVATAHAAVRHARAELATVEGLIATAGRDLMPATAGGRVRLAAGAAGPALVVAVVGWLAFGGRPAVIATVADEAAVKGAVGLVVCGVRVTDAGGRAHEVPFETGTAFAVTADGVLFTNRHVVEKVANLRAATAVLDQARRRGQDVVPTVWVFFDRKKQVADLVFVSEQYDFAILKVPRPPGRVFALRGAAAPARGQAVFALGFPGVANEPMTAGEALNLAARQAEARPRVERLFLDKAFDFVLTSGHVSRPTDIDGQAWVQHDAALHPGSSGGPLVTEDGVVVGINTLKHATAAGVAFSLGLPQLRAEAAAHAPGLVWK